MAKLSMGRMAEEAGVNKSTLSRWITKGLVSQVEKQPDGSMLIDASEIDNIHRLKEKSAARSDKRNRSRNPDKEPSGTDGNANGNSTLHHELELVRKDLEHERALRREKEARLSDMERERDEWREQAKKQTLLLTVAQEKQEEAEEQEAAVKPRQSMWKWLLG